jgi:hypothetical protein
MYMMKHSAGKLNTKEMKPFLIECAANVAITQKVFVLRVCIEIFKLIQGVLNRDVSILLMNPVCVQAVSVFIILPLLLSSGIPWNTLNTSLFLILTSFPGIYRAVTCKMGVVACLCFSKLCIQSCGVQLTGFVG